MSSLTKMLSIVGGLGCSVCGVVASGVTFSGFKTEGEKVLNPTLEEKAVDSSEVSEGLNSQSQGKWLTLEEQAREDKKATEEWCERWSGGSGWANGGREFIDQQCSGKAAK